MEKVMRIKNNAVLLLMFSILLLCIGFIVVGCGTSPQLKIDDPNAGPHALDLTDCPNSPCSVTFNSGTAPAPDKQIGGRPITFEAWIKPKSTSAGTVLQRGSSVRGAVLQVKATSTPDSVVPRFEIRRLQSDGTSTVAYFVAGTPVTINSDWVHIAGILTNQDHSATVGHPACAGVDGDATDDVTHLDIYQNGIIIACAATHDGQVADDTPEDEAYADEPEATTASITFQGIIDEARIWNTDREQFLSECMSRELDDTSVNCNFKNNMILYSYFNAEKGSSVADRSGTMGSGTKEYPDPDTAGIFHHWETGWTTDTPF